MRAEVEHGGGIYLVVGVRHVLEDSGSPLEQSATVVRVIVDVKPQHTATVREDTAAVDLALEEIVSVPIVPLSVELSVVPESEE